MIRDISFELGIDLLVFYFVLFFFPFKVSSLEEEVQLHPNDCSCKKTCNKEYNCFHITHNRSKINMQLKRKRTDNIAIRKSSLTEKPSLQKHDPSLVLFSKNIIVIQPWKPSNPQPEESNPCEQAWPFVSSHNNYPSGCLYSRKCHKTTKWYYINHVLKRCST